MNPAPPRPNPTKPAPVAPKHTGQLGVFDAVNIIVGIVIGTTIFKLAPLIFMFAGSPVSALFIWMIGGALAFIGALCYAELATSFPRSGGDYVYLTKAFGPWAGFLFGWAQLVIVLTCSIGAMAVVFGEYASNLYDLTQVVQYGGLSSTFLYAAGAIVVISLLNVIGVVLGKWVQNLLTVLKVAGVLAIIVAGFGWGDWSNALATRKVLFQKEFAELKQEDKLPGDFEVVALEAPKKGQALRGVAKGDSSWVRLELPGEVRPGSAADVKFSHQLVGGDSVKVELFSKKTGQTKTQEVKLAEGWSESSVRFEGADGKELVADEIRFLVPGQGTLQIEKVSLSAPQSIWNSFQFSEASLLALIFIMYAYGGWNDAAFVASEVDNPRRNIPRALLFGVGIITAVYLLVNLAYLVGLGYETASNPGQLIPLLVLQKMTLLGDWGSKALSAIIMVSALGAVNGLIFTGARVYGTLGNDHRLFGFLGHWKPGHGAPILALIVQALIALSMVAGFGTTQGQEIINVGLGRISEVSNRVYGIEADAPGAIDLTIKGAVKADETFDKLFAISAPFFWVFFLATGLSLFVLRDITAKTGRPFSVPLYPVLPIIFCNVCVWMIYRAFTYMHGGRQLTPVFACFVVLVLMGLPLYWISSRIGYRDTSDDEA
jgi:amino acid transporter